MPDLQNQLFDRAYDLFSVHQYEAAEEELLGVLKDTPDDPWALALLALCLSCRNDFDAACKRAQAAIKLAPDLAFAHYAMASILDDQDLFDEALISIRQAIRLDPDDPLYYAQLAMIYYQQHRWAEALQTADRGLAMRPNDSDCRQIREQVLEAGDFEASLETRDPLDQRVALEVASGRSCLEQDQVEEALSHFRQALAIDPDNHDVREGVLACLAKQTPVRSAVVRFFMHLGELRLWLRTAMVCAAFICWPLAQGWLAEDRGLGWGLIAAAVAVYLLWMAVPIRNALLLTAPAGAHILSRAQRAQAKWLYLLLALLFGWSIVWVIGQWPTAALMVVVTALLSVPISRVYEVPRGWSRLAMALYAVVIGILAMATIGLSVERIYPIDQAAMYLMMLAVILSAVLARYLNRSTARHRASSTFGAAAD